MAESTVLLRRGALGDVVLLGSVTAAITGPVIVACDPRWAGIAAHLRGVDQVVSWDTPVRGRLVDLQGGLRGRRRMPWGPRIRKRSLRRRLRLWTGVGEPRPTVPELYAEAVGVSPVPPPWIDVGRGPGLALIPGAAWAPKRWAAERFAQVGRTWGGPVWVLGGPGEEALVERVASELPGAHRVVERGFERTLAALGQCAVAVAGDTGLMHLAGACGLPVVAVFGPTHPEDGFWVYPGELVQREVACRPCALHRVERCKRGDHRCMAIEADQVVAAVRRCAG